MKLQQEHNFNSWNIPEVQSPKVLKCSQIFLKLIFIYNIFNIVFNSNSCPADENDLRM